MKNSFTVIWSEFAESDLAKIWLRANDRVTMAKVIDDFDARMKVNPDSLSEEDREGLRFATLPGLRVTYSVNEQDRIVNVLRIREIH